jgi:hypothetical protein
MRTESGDTAGSGLIRWTYGRPAGQPGLDPFVYVAFVRNTSGEYKLSYDPVLASPFFDWNDDSTRLAGVGDFLSLMGQRSSRSPLDVMLDLGRMQEVPPQEKKSSSRTSRRSRRSPSIRSRCPSTGSSRRAAGRSSS